MYIWFMTLFDISMLCSTAYLIRRHKLWLSVKLLPNEPTIIILSSGQIESSHTLKQR